MNITDFYIAVRYNDSERIPVGIIEATSIEDALSTALSKFMVLPNQFIEIISAPPSRAPWALSQ